MQVYVIDSDYIMVNDKPIIRIYGKDERGKSVCVINSGFLPYFYMKTDNPDELRSRIGEMQGSNKVEETERFDPMGYHESKERVFKITTNNPAKVPEMREQVRGLGSLFESDILFPYRFMADHGIGCMSWIEVEGRPIKTDVIKVSCIEATSIKPVDREDHPQLRVLSFDMETNQPLNRGPMAGEDPILMISMNFSEPYKGKDTSIIVARKIKDYEDIESFNDEKEMLEKFSEIVDDYDPDVITGYNITGFDFPALLGRMEKYNLKKAFGRVRDKQTWCKMVGQIQRCAIVGRTVADCYAIVKKNSAQDPRFKFKRFNLDTVAKALLGKEKHDMDWKKMYGMYMDNEEIKTVIDYARQDCILPLEMLQKKDLLGQFIAIARLSGISLQDVLDGGQGPRIDSYLLREFNRRGFMLPEKPQSVADMERDYKGGLVLEPEKGLHAEGCVLVLDFKSLYPSIIRTFNICPTTLTEDPAISDEAPSGSRFVREEHRKGIIPEILRVLMESRSKVKKEMSSADDDLRRILDSKQFAIKTMANSFYGYLGYTRARIYRMEIASSITAYGRQLIEQTRDTLMESGYRIVYGDTDSVMVHVDTKNLDEAAEIGESLIEKINDKLPGVLELEFEKVFRTFLIIAKKRYAAWSFEPKGEGEWRDKIDMKGIETVRRDWCSLVSETQKRVLEIILKEGDVKKAIEVVKDEVNNLRNGDVDLSRLSITKGITKDLSQYDGKLPHIELARKMLKRNPAEPPATGSRISFVIVSGSQMLSERAEDPDYIQQNNLPIDSDYYIDNQLIPPVERIFSSIGVQKEELLGNGRQVSLHDMLRGGKPKRNHDVSVKRNPVKSSVSSMEGFVCGTCEKDYRRVPLAGKCDCGGDMLVKGNGEIGKAAIV